MNQDIRSVLSSSILVCPKTKQPLTIYPLKEAEQLIFKGSPLVPQVFHGLSVLPVSATPFVLVRKDNKCAYPVVDGIPILLAPEALTVMENALTVDLTDDKYAEAYKEMIIYNQIADDEAKSIRESESYKIISPTLQISGNMNSEFPDPKHVFIDAVYDCASQWDAYSHIAPLKGKRILQLGGKGIHAVKFLKAGAAEAWLVTPIAGEARCALELARVANVLDKIRCVVAIGEELPFSDDSFDAIYSGGCVHHMVTSVAIPEFRRILRTGGKLSAVDPWRAPLYAVGTKMFGQREKAECKPLTVNRIAPLHSTFRISSVVHHGALTRYPLLALHKLGLKFDLSTVWKLSKIDDAISSSIPGLHKWGSSVVLLGEK